MTKRKDPAAVSLGRRGGAAKTKAQTEARRKVMEAINDKKCCPKCKAGWRSKEHQTKCKGERK